MIRSQTGTVVPGGGESRFVAVRVVGPSGFAVPPRELEEFLTECLVFLPPPVTTLLGFFRGQRLLGQPRVVSILRADLHVYVADDMPVTGDRTLRDSEVPVRQSNDKHR